MGIYMYFSCYHLATNPSYAANFHLLTRCVCNAVEGCKCQNFANCSMFAEWQYLGGQKQTRLHTKSTNKGPFTLAIFCSDFCCGFVAISNHPCKLLVIPQRFESPLVYTDDLKSCLKSQLTSPLKSQQKLPVSMGLNSPPLLLMCHRSGTIDIHEFAALWKYIQDWKNCFDGWVFFGIQVGTQLLDIICK